MDMHGDALLALAALPVLLRARLRLLYLHSHVRLKRIGQGW